MKIGCQTITFGVELHRDKKDIEFIFKTLNESGYDGIENGFHRFDVNKLDFYLEMSQKYNIEFAAVHVGGNYEDPESVKREKEKLPQITDFAKKLGCKFLFISGSNDKNPDWKVRAKNYDDYGKMVADSGMTLCFHNHDWEIWNDVIGLYTFRDLTKPEHMSFVLDVGWVKRGGVDPVAVLKNLGDRVNNIHFKEFTEDGTITELGRGCVDFNAVWEVAKNMNIHWVISEQDRSEAGDRIKTFANEMLKYAAANSVKDNFNLIKSVVR